MALIKGFNDAVVVDVETTGLDPQSDRIVSVALIRSSFESLRANPNGLHGETMDALVNPQRRIPKQASRIHGITDENVSDKGPFSDVAQELRDFIGDLPIIAHNVSFDKGFLNAEFKRAGVKTLARNRSYCTMRRYREFNHGTRKGSSLDDVVEAMGVCRRQGNIHEAVEDANLAWQVAAMFYMMDNQISTPSGTLGPSRTGNHDAGGASRFLQRKSGSGAGPIVGAAIVVGLFAWWIL